MKRTIVIKKMSSTKNEKLSHVDDYGKIQNRKEEDPELTIEKSLVSEDILKVRSNTKRQVEIKKEIDETQEDRYAFCDFCQEPFLDYCPKCGQLAILQDTVVEMGIENRATLTLPCNSLEIKPSEIHGLGVFSKVLLNKGIKMGPYQGITTRVESTMGFSWILRNGTLVDHGDERNSNWIRYVNCARHFEEQNLVAFQYKGELYYKTCRVIQPGEELLVYYAKNIITNLEMNVKSYFKPKEDYIVEDGRYCQFCSIGYRDSSLLDNHIILCKSNPANSKKPPENIFICRFCAIGITDEKLYKNHEKLCDKRNQSSEANRQDVVEGKLKGICSQTTATLGEKVFSCSKCDYTAKRANDLFRHDRIHKDKQLYDCELCEKSFQQKGNLHKHMFAHLDVADSIEIIEEQKILDNNGSRKIFKALIKGSYFKVFSFECEKCELRTAELSNLKTHINAMHTRARTFRCRVCAFETSRKANMKSHQNSVHFKNSTWKCDQCEYEASEKQTLKYHIKTTHDKIKDHECGICSFKAYRKYDLKIHTLSVHLNDKKFKCEFCNFAAVSKDKLTCHLNGVHLKNVKFSCPSCKFFSYWKTHLNRHVKKDHQS